MKSKDMPGMRMRAPAKKRKRRKKKGSPSLHDLKSLVFLEFPHTSRPGPLVHPQGFEPWTH